MVKSYININFGILEIFFNNARRILDGSRKFQGVQRGDFEGGKKKKKTRSCSIFHRAILHNEIVLRLYYT